MIVSKSTLVSTVEVRRVNLDPLPKMQTTRSISSASIARSSSGDGLESPACPARTNRPNGSIPLSKSWMERHHSSRWPCTRANTVRHSELSDFLLNCSIRVVPYHWTLHNRFIRAFLFATDNDSLSWAPFRRLSQKYVFRKSSDVGSPRIAFTTHVTIGLSIWTLDAPYEVLGCLELRPDLNQRSILAFRVSEYCTWYWVLYQNSELWFMTLGKPSLQISTYKSQRKKNHPCRNHRKNQP